MKTYHIVCNGHRIDKKHFESDVRSYFFEMLGRPITSRESFLLRRQGVHFGGNLFKLETETAEQIAACQIA